MDNSLRISGLVNESIVDGPGIRLVVFAQGCIHNCPECHNPHTHSFKGGYTISIDEIVELVKKNPLLDGVTLSGGDPFEQADVFGKLAKTVNEIGLHVMTYTGYKFEELLKQTQHKKDWNMLLKYSDIIVDGKYEKDKMNLDLKFIGSANQRIIDVKATLANNEIIRVEFFTD